MIDTRGLKKSEVLAALYNHSKCYFLEEYHLYDPADMSPEDAEDWIRYLIKGSNLFYINAIMGRTLKVDLSSDDEFNEYLYDSYNGEGRAQEAIDKLRHTKEV